MGEVIAFYLNFIPGPKFVSPTPSSPVKHLEGPSMLDGTYFYTKGISYFDIIQIVYAIYILNIENMPNFYCMSERFTLHKTEISLGPSDALIISGDILDELYLLKHDISFLVSEFQCAVFFVPINHEAWVDGKDVDKIGLTTSLRNLAAIKDLCDDLGYHTSHRFVGSVNHRSAWIVPINSWYDGKIALLGCEDILLDFIKWPWVDFMRFKWTFQPEESGILGKIPTGLTEYFLKHNKNAEFCKLVEIK